MKLVDTRVLEEMEEDKNIIKNCYVRFSIISSKQATWFEKEKGLINIQKIRPGRSAMQWHIKTSFIFLLDKRAPNGPV